MQLTQDTAAASLAGRRGKTRLAPTPSGFLHLGNALSFIITATLAAAHGLELLLRIDDLDRQRMRPEYLQDIFDTLAFLDISWQEGPRNPEEHEQRYSQLHRMQAYTAALAYLEKAELLFACTCSRAERALNDGHCLCRDRELPLSLPGCCWRLRTDEIRPLVLHAFSGPVSVLLPEQEQYFVVRKKDGFPAYQLSSLVDDLHFGSTLIVRGADLWPSTLAQLYLASVMGTEFDRTVFYHHVLLQDNSGRKLSKSEGATSLRYLRQSGHNQGQVLNLIARLAGITAPVSDWYGLGQRLLQYAGTEIIAAGAKPLS